jgi:translation initiation factor 6 (eIF-6)
MVKKKVALLEIDNNSNIGLFSVINDKFAIFGNTVKKEILDKISKIIKVPIFQTTILNSDLIGVFLSLNNEFLLYPKGILEQEKLELLKISKKFEMKLIEVDDLVNTLGNSICIGKKEIILSNEFHKKTIKLLEKKSEKKLIIFQDKNYHLTGSLLRFFNKSYFVGQETSEEDIKLFEKKIKCLGTVNKGSSFISSGILINKYGLLLGSNCSTIEIQNITDWANNN